MLLALLPLLPLLSSPAETRKGPSSSNRNSGILCRGMPGIEREKNNGWLKETQIWTWPTNVTTLLDSRYTTDPFTTFKLQNRHKTAKNYKIEKGWSGILREITKPPGLFLPNMPTFPKNSNPPTSLKRTFFIVVSYYACLPNPPFPTLLRRLAYRLSSQTTGG